MLQLFRNQNPISLLLLGVILVFLRLPYMIYANSGIEVNSWNIPFIGTHAQIFIVVGIIFAQAIWINYIFTDAKLLEEKTVVPALIWILVTSIDLEVYMIDSSLVISTILLAIIHIFILNPSNSISIRRCFQLGILNAILLLIEPSFVIFIPIIILMIYNVNAKGIREYLVFFIGIIMVLFWFWTFSYLFESEVVWREKLIAQFRLPSYHFTSYEYVIWGILAVFAVWGAIKMLMLTNSASLILKKNVNTFLLMSIGILLVILVSTGWDTENNVILLIPLTFFTSIVLLIIRKTKWAELAFGIFVVAILSSIILTLLRIL